MSKRPRHVHIAGIGGTAMAAVALLAKAQGWHVTGSDEAVYPPMSEVLATAHITVSDYGEANLSPAPDLCLIGNALSRGHPEVEAVLRWGIPYSSGAAFIGEHILPGRHAMVVAGTHGKTSTASMLAHILHTAGHAPGFMIGGIPENFGQGACLGAAAAPFVLEGDEYDTALFDKRSKFLHYHARTLILNNLEFDHADIFPDLEAIKVQFAYLLRTVPDNGLIIVNADDVHLKDVLSRGCWSPVTRFAHADSSVTANWRWRAERADGRRFTLWHQGALFADIEWCMLGAHQAGNACAAAAAAYHHGVDADTIYQALTSFRGVRRRMTLITTLAGVRIYDDFAHHPTAIRSVVDSAAANLRAGGRLWVLLDPCSNTMRSRHHQHALPACFAAADRLLCFAPKARDTAASDLLDVAQLCQAVGDKAAPADAETLAHQLGDVHPDDDILLLSNGGISHWLHVLQQQLLR